jgi:hypothetical protein
MRRQMRVPKRPEHENENGRLGELCGGKLSTKHGIEKAGVAPVGAVHDGGATGGTGDRREEEDHARLAPAKRSQVSGSGESAWMLRGCGRGEFSCGAAVMANLTPAVKQRRR